MRISVSNIAWDVLEDEQVASLLNKYAIDSIDIAPGKYFSDPINATSDDILQVRNWWLNRGVEVAGMQALLFGTTGLNLFGSQDSQMAMLEHLESICRIASGLGATKLAFGSPKNRDCSVLPDDQVLDIAVRFFRQLGDIASLHGVEVCLEPNPSCYGANFMTNSEDTASIVAAVAHPAIRMQLDTGALAINDENPGRVIEEYEAMIGHVHASEPGLVTLGDGGVNHAAIALQLSRLLPEKIVTIEMLSDKKEPNIEAIERALGVAVCHYRVGSSGESEVRL